MADRGAGNTTVECGEQTAGLPFRWLRCNSGTPHQHPQYAHGRNTSILFFPLMRRQVRCRRRWIDAVMLWADIPRFRVQLPDTPPAELQAQVNVRNPLHAAATTGG